MKLTVVITEACHCYQLQIYRQNDCESVWILMWQINYR